jgi:hypothetical protein
MGDIQESADSETTHAGGPRRLGLSDWIGQLRTGADTPGELAMAQAAPQTVGVRTTTGQARLSPFVR